VKSILGITLFILLGFLMAVFIAFPSAFSRKTLPYDYEQQGLNQQIVIKFAYVVAENTPKGLAAEKFANLVDKDTHGQVKVELFPDGTLYNEFDEIPALEKGNIQMTAPSFSIVASQIPQWSIMDLPFAFANQQAVNAALDGDIGQQLLNTLPAKNMVGLALWTNGFRQLTDDKRSLLYPSDLTGLKFRTETSQVSEAEFRQMGASALALPFNQLYDQLQRHAVDGEENSISNIYSQKLYQVQKYLTISQISYLGYVVLINKPFWNGLSPSFRNEIQQAMAETTAWERKQAVLLNQQQLQAMKSQHSMQVTTLTPTQKKQWIQTLQPIYSQFYKTFGPHLMNDLAAIQRSYGQ